MPVSGYIITSNSDLILLSPKSIVIKLTRIGPEESQKIQGDISKAMALLAPAISKIDILPNLKDWDSRIKRGKLQYEVLDPLS